MKTQTDHQEDYLDGWDRGSRGSPVVEYDRSRNTRLFVLGMSDGYEAYKSAKSQAALVSVEAVEASLAEATLVLEQTESGLVQEQEAKFKVISDAIDRARKRSEEAED